jgi:hypothetical protein
MDLIVKDLYKLVKRQAATRKQLTAMVRQNPKLEAMLYQEPGITASLVGWRDMHRVFLSMLQLEDTLPLDSRSEGGKDKVREEMRDITGSPDHIYDFWTCAALYTHSKNETYEAFCKKNQGSFLEKTFEMTEESAPNNQTYVKLIGDLEIGKEQEASRKWQSIDMDVIEAYPEIEKHRHNGLKLSMGIYEGCGIEEFQVKVGNPSGEDGSPLPIKK